MNRTKRNLLIAAGSILLLDSLILIGRTNGNLGIYLPGLFGLPLLLLGLFQRRIAPFFQKRGGKLLRLALIGLYVLSSLYFSLMSAFLYHRGSQQVPENADVLIVLGCGLYGERPSLTLKRRLDTAYAYLSENPDTLCIVSGGQGPGESISEALAMQRYLVDRGLDESRILPEDQSRSTKENFLFSKALLDQHFDSEAEVVFVTTRFHVYRASQVAITVGIDAAGIGSRSLYYIAPNDYLRECCVVLAY